MTLTAREIEILLDALDIAYADDDAPFFNEGIIKGEKELSDLEAKLKLMKTSL